MRRFLRGAIAAIALVANSSLAMAGEYSSAAAESNHAITGQHYLVSVFGTASVAGYLMTFDATSAPVDGAVTPKECIPVASGSWAAHDLQFAPDNYGSGIVVVFSTTGCATKTASATAFFFVRYK